MGCLLPFLPLHMLAVGLVPREIRTISMITPTVAILGPLIAGPIADHVAASSLRLQTAGVINKSINSSNGRYLRVMIAVCCVFSALFYSLLLMVPVVKRIDLPHELRPAVKFSCNENGAIIHQERCQDTIGCYRWKNEDLIGTLHLKKCKYECYPIYEKLRKQFQQTQRESKISTMSLIQTETNIFEDTIMFDGEHIESSGDENGFGVMPLESSTEIILTTTISTMMIKQEHAGKWDRYIPQKNESPHICYNDTLGRTICHVFTKLEYTNETEDLTVKASLGQALNPEDTDDWCAYPISQFFSCRIPVNLEKTMAKLNQSCVVECLLQDPYKSDSVENNILAESQCRQVIGNEQLTFWMYLAIRTLADIFPTAGVALIDATVVIATRETLTDRGDVGHQLAFGSLGFAVFGPLCGYLTTILSPNPSYYAPLGLHALLSLITACIALSADTMLLSPPEWWWHTHSGMLALPMSAIRKYGGEAAALFVVLVLMGVFWSAIDSYLSMHLFDLKGNELSIGLAVTMGALPAVLFLWKSEHLVDYCGHSNILINAFIIYIVRFTGLSFVPDVWWALTSESFELFTLEIMWVTAILYFRHLIPRQMTATGQALPVIAHFCIGRAIGAAISACIDKVNRDDEVESMRYIYQCMAIAAAIIAILYFILYHGILKPQCHSQKILTDQRQSPTIAQAMNGNGNYTPLKVYHNSMGRKGQFRY